MQENEGQPFFLDEDSDVSEDDAGNFAQDDDVRDGARPIIRPERGADGSDAAERDAQPEPDRTRGDR